MNDLELDDSRNIYLQSVRRAQSAIAELDDLREHNPLSGDPLPSVSGLSVKSSKEWPEILPVKTELLPVSPLPLTMVPAPFRGWAKDVSERMQCPLDFVATAMIVVVGSIIGAGCGIRPKKHDDWTVVPNLWGGVVGRPSMLKTPAISEGLKPMEALESAAKQEHDAAMNGHMAEIEAFKANREALQSEMRQVAKAKGKSGANMESLKTNFASLKEPAAPIWRRYKTNDATIEKMAELQAQNPRGLLLFRDELIGLFATWDREHHESDRSFYLESWNGISPYTTDRIGRGTLYVENLCVSIFGGIQPSKLTSYLHGAMRGQNNDGMVQRLQVMVYPDEPATWNLVDTPINAAAKQTAYDVVRRLAAMDFAQHGAYRAEGERLPYYRFDEAGQSVFYEWLAALEGKLRAGDDEPVVLEHLGKYRSLMPSLALIFHLLAVAEGNSRDCLQVSGASAEYAAAWCGYLESHARRIYGMVTNLTAQAAARLASKLSQGLLPESFTVRDVYRKDWSLLDDRPVIERACEELVSLGWLREKVTPPAPGQRGKTEYITNPKVRAH
ncbi:MAG: YfjI family protein, partial [Nitrospirales bacterium]